MIVKLQKDNIELMKTNDRESNQLNLERKATIDNMEEIIDVKIKPVLDILKDLPRK